ncbi:diiron oxygenase [Actinomycetospora sp. TBRC 11914]|uniref:AurF N-oxygenase family protein n=1 Tax=Actinomycetospora sp. TBRC 11914 TaxID=2729387 RepID=UPI00145D2DFD|nr:diiron oxygenase [Actinomycetospora sp. TBRC 11914]NMO89051.1 diiron oxygenase [Actinomycetospora sp. TBRC 11914]
MTTLDRDHGAARLLTASARHTLDPDLEVDWAAPVDPWGWAVPPERVSLYGTGLWDDLDDDARRTLARHEAASLLSVGLWFEVLLMQMLTRYAYDLDLRRPHAQYALTEVGDETRHSVMFARTVDALGCPDYRPHGRLHRVGGWYGHLGAGASMFASVLVAEEATDRLQRESMHDDRVLPLMRSVARVHVVEEARHVRFAREELARLVPTLSPAALEKERWLTALVGTEVVNSLWQARIYRSVGLSGRVGRAAARANPHHRATKRFMLEKVLAFLAEVGMVGGPSERLWRRALD